jgi:MinD superfamily P-loop ATPase
VKIAICSGKGGTGKTTLAVGLAFTAEQGGLSVAYLDCDVEEPNGHLFLRPVLTSGRRACRPVPTVNEEACCGCGKCGEICRFSAIVCVNGSVMTFPELCHSCGGCALACPCGAITESPRVIGRVETGRSRNTQLVHGILNIGEAMSPPLIKQVKDESPEADLVIIDSPPGTSCPVIESVRASDFVILVTESTPFGLNDLKLAVEMVRALELDCGVVVNRSGFDDQPVEKYCLDQNIEIIGKLPHDRKVAEAYSRGEIISHNIPEHKRILDKILSGISVFVDGKSGDRRKVLG